jgi:Ca2+-binding RTX toxin-like protein
MPTNFNYGEVLQKSFLFYEAQRSGKLPPDKRILWRGDSALNDGSTVNRDLSGGYYDAGDNVKFVFPMAAALSTLAWGLIEYKNGYIQSNQYDEALDTLKWGVDWLLKAHETDSLGTQAFWAQVGDGNVDHSTWLPPEQVGTRPAFKLDRQNPGTDLAAEAAAVLAAASIVFRAEDPIYADKLLKNATQLYAFADDADLNPTNNGTNGELKKRGRYSDVIPNGQTYYYSYSGYNDELLWGATWMHKAQLAKLAADPTYTPTTSYLAIAEQQYLVTYFDRGWTQTWDGKSSGATILLAQLTNKPQYRNDVEGWLNRWLPPGSANRPADGVAYSPGGLAWLGEWGSLRLTANTAFLAGIYTDTVLNQPNGVYSQFAQQQINYMLGNNPQNLSYVVGFGNNSPKQPHHRAASGIIGYGSNYSNPNLPNAYVLYGALVGGPKSASDSDYQDLRTDYIANEVALDYNAGFTGAIARMYQKFGGTPIRDEQLNTLNGITYNPHLQVRRGSNTHEAQVTTYGTVSASALPQLNIFLDNRVQIIGDGWKKLDLNSNYSITANTILQFEFRSDSNGDTHGIGFDNDNTVSVADGSRFIQLSGSQSFGPAAFKNYAAGSGWRTYSLRVSDLFTGSFRYLTLANDNDAANSTASSDFRNIALFEGPTPAIGTSGNDYLVGSAANDNLSGIGGNDFLVSSAGGDILDGGNGIDTVSYEGNSNRVVIDLAAGSAQKGGGEVDTLISIENVYGSNFDDLIIGNTVENVIFGRAGNDRLIGNDGNDILHGGFGNDTIDGQQGNDQINGGLGDDTLNGGDHDDTFSYTIGDGADTIDGGLGIDTLNVTGTNADDTLNVIYSAVNGITKVEDGTVTGVETINADLGVGSDTLDYTGSASGVTVNLATSTASGFNSPVAGIENVTGTAFADSLRGDLTANVLSGGGGADYIDGGDGVDTINGDAGADTLIGGAGDDTINGLADNDFISGGSGVDVIAGGDGDDYLDGGADNDTIAGGIGIDNLYGQGGIDHLSGDDGDDYIDGGDGNDIIDGGAGNDLLIGGAGDDQLTGLGGDDFFSGGAGVDMLSGGDGNDYMVGGDDNDLINGDGGNDVLIGGTGDDTLNGLADHDILLGDGGIDILNGGDGDDYLDGGGDNDTLNGSAGADALVGGGGDDHLTGGDGDDFCSGGAGVDALIGGDGNDYMDGGADNDTIAGGIGIDNLYGQAGVDTLNGGDGNDYIDGGDGNDNIDGGAGADILVGSDGDDTIVGLGGDDFCSGGSGIDTLTGGDGNDYMVGGDDNDFIYGDGGIDLLIGGAGNDTLLGGAGNDYLLGDAGNDYLLGDAGTNTLTGGTGNDRFVYNPGALGDTITDFNTVEDILDLRGLFTMGITPNITTYELVLSANGNDTLVNFDADGAAEGANFVTIATLQGVTAGLLTIGGNVLVA